MQYFRCGKVMTTHGIKGDLKIQLLSDFDRFKKGNKLYIKHNNEYVLVTVNNSRPFGKYLLVNFEGLLDINLVEKFHSDEIFVSIEDRNDNLSEDEFYYSDLINLQVYNQKGELRGFVQEIKQLPQCDYLYVNYNNKNFYIPFINEFIIEVSDKIVVNEIEGLFNEN